MTDDADSSSHKVYQVGLVGELHYQWWIARLSVGDAVLIAHEIDNPHDPDALVALVKDKPMGLNPAILFDLTPPQMVCIGYIPRSSWLQRAIHDEHKAVAAAVAAINSGEHGLLGVVLHVLLQDGPIAQVRQSDRPNQQSILDVLDGPTPPKQQPGPKTPAPPSPPKPEIPKRASFWQRIFGSSRP